MKNPFKKNTFSHPSHIYVDAGGTKTRFLLCDENKYILKSIAVPSNLSILKTQIQTILIPYSSLIPITVGIRGVWTSKEKKAWEHLLHGLSNKLIVISDVELVYEWVFGSTQGILLNAGTGSIAFGVAKNGKRFRKGGLGPLLGDDGSGFWIGREYLRTEYNSKGQVEKLRPYAVGPDPVRRIAELAKKIIENPAAKNKKIVLKAQNHLLNLLKDIRMKFPNKSAVPVQLVGGLFQNNSFRRSFIRMVKKSRLNVLFSDKHPIH